MDQQDLISVVAPSTWKAEYEVDKDYSLMELTSTGEYSIDLFVTSRIIDRLEAELDRIELLNRMMMNAKDHLLSEGCEIIDIGKAKEFVKGCPAFVITALLPNDRRVITQWGTIVGNRNYSINLFTSDKQHSPEVADIADKLIESININVDPTGASIEE